MKQNATLAAAAFAAFLGTTASAAELYDNDVATRETLNALSNACVSYREKDINNCVGKTIELTNNVAHTLKLDMSKIPAFDGKKRDVIRRIDFACLNNFQNVNTAIAQGRYNGNTQLYVQEGFLASRFCLQAIERETSARDINFLPGARALLHEMIDTAEQEKLVFRHRI